MDSRSEPVILLLGVGGSESEGFDYSLVCFVFQEKKAERH